MSERLQFQGDDAQYDSYAFSQHVGRYLALRKHVRGKRVLDMACGEGYATRLLRSWGAREVVGVDISEAALATAVELFGGKGISFVHADIDNDADKLATLGKFDVIVSFETIEHLKQPPAFLALIDRLRGDDTIVAISAPCEAADELAEIDNPYHLWRFSFEDFRDMTEAQFGPASQWLLGTPAYGEMNFVIDDARVESGHGNPVAVLDMQLCELAAILPSKSGNGVSRHSCAHYLGVWGAKPGANAVVSGQTFAQFREPWEALEWQRQHISRLEAELAHRDEIEASLRRSLVEEQAKREAVEAAQAKMRPVKPKSGATATKRKVAKAAAPSTKPR